MKRALRILLIIVLVIIVGVGGLLAYVKMGFPKVGPAPELKVESTPERIARGEYLANNVMLCIDCHSERDWSIFSGPLVEGSEGKGGEVFDQAFGFPGRYVAKNITPAGLSSWTDGEIFRAITSGVSKDGKPLFPIMPHPNFGQLDKEDIYDVIAYIRTLPSIERPNEESKSDFPMNIIINTIPKEAQFSTRPAETDQVAYGKYLVTAASCQECHTKFDKGEFTGEPLSGGRVFPFPDGSVLQSANITPHATGIGNWTEEMFLGKFRQYTDSTYVPQKVQPGTFQTMMPWTMYARMTDSDLKAIYAYLKTVPAVENVVVKYTPPAEAKG